VTVRASQTSQGRDKEPLWEAPRRGRTGQAGPGEHLQIAARLAGKNELLADDHLAASAQEATEVALARLEASSLEFVTGRGSCNGMPELAARTVIELKGLGSSSAAPTT